MKKLLLALPVMLLLAAGCNAKQQEIQSQPQNQQSVPQTQNNTSQPEASAWKTYTDTEFEFQAKYPNAWSVDFGKDLSDNRAVNFTSPKEKDGNFSVIVVQRSKTGGQSSNLAGVGTKTTISLSDGTKAILDTGRSDGTNGVSEQYITFDHNGYEYFVWYQIHKTPTTVYKDVTPARLTDDEVKIRDTFLANFKFTK